MANFIILYVAIHWDVILQLLWVTCHPLNLQNLHNTCEAYIVITEHKYPEFQSSVKSTSCDKAIYTAFTNSNHLNIIRQLQITNMSG